MASGALAETAAEAPRKAVEPKRRPGDSAGTESKPVAAGNASVAPASVARAAVEKSKLPGQATAVAAAGSSVATTPSMRSPSTESVTRLMDPNFAAAQSGQPAQLPPARESSAISGAGAEAGPAFAPLSSLRFTKFVEPAGNDGLFDRNSTSGWVVVSFHIDTDGRTDNISVVEASSKARRYEAAAISAVRRWRFEPVIEGGKAVPRQTTVRIRFEPK
jgi:TonB family protein